MSVDACGGSGSAVEQWDLRLPLDLVDLDPEVAVQSFITTIRANLEEWWYTKDREPHTAAWGRRRSGDS